MIYARLSYNKNNWETPSGPYGKSRNRGVHECDYGFGFEEWLFSKKNILSDKDGKKYHFGYLEGINKNYKQGDENESLVLFTINNATHQRFIVGEIKSWQPINEIESTNLVQQKPELIDSMREEVRLVTPHPQLSINKFNKHLNNHIELGATKPLQLFNIKFEVFDYRFDSDNPINNIHIINNFNRFWLHRR